MPNFMDFALNMIRNNPRIANNSRSQQIVNAIQTKDFNAAQQIATQICQERGMSINDAYNMTNQGMQNFSSFK